MDAKCSAMLRLHRLQQALPGLSGRQTSKSRAVECMVGSPATAAPVKSKKAFKASDLRNATLPEALAKVDFGPVHVKKSKVEDGGKYKYARTASNIQGGLETLIQKSDQLKADVKASKAGVQQYEEVIFRLEERKAFLQKRIDKNKRWTDVYDTDIGPFESKYVTLVDEIGVLYGAAKDKHLAAINLLIREFNYHPIFKHWDDEFTGVPFRPA